MTGAHRAGQGPGNGMTRERTGTVSLAGVPARHRKAAAGAPREDDIPVIDPAGVPDDVVAAVTQALLAERIDLDPETARLAAACVVLAPAVAGAAPVPVPEHARRVAWRVLLRHGYPVRKATARLAAAVVLVPPPAVAAAAKALGLDEAGPGAAWLAAAAVLAADGNDPGCPPPRGGPAAALARLLVTAGHGDPGPGAARLACDAVLAITRSAARPGKAGNRANPAGGNARAVPSVAGTLA